MYQNQSSAIPRPLTLARQASTPSGILQADGLSQDIIEVVRRVSEVQSRLRSGKLHLLFEREMEYGISSGAEVRVLHSPTIDFGRNDMRRVAEALVSYVHLFSASNRQINTVGEESNPTATATEHMRNLSRSPFYDSQTPGWFPGKEVEITVHTREEVIEVSETTYRLFKKFSSAFLDKLYEKFFQDASAHLKELTKSEGQFLTNKKDNSRSPYTMMTPPWMRMKLRCGRNVEINLVKAEIPNKRMLRKKQKDDSIACILASFYEKEGPFAKTALEVMIQAQQSEPCVQSTAGHLYQHSTTPWSALQPRAGRDIRRRTCTEAGIGLNLSQNNDGNHGQRDSAGNLTSPLVSRRIDNPGASEAVTTANESPISMSLRDILSPTSSLAERSKRKGYDSSVERQRRNTAGSSPESTPDSNTIRALAESAQGNRNSPQMELQRPLKISRVMSDSERSEPADAIVVSSQVSADNEESSSGDFQVGLIEDDSTDDEDTPDPDPKDPRYIQVCTENGIQCSTGLVCAYRMMASAQKEEYLHDVCFFCNRKAHSICMLAAGLLEFRASILPEGNRDAPVCKGCARIRDTFDL